MRFICSNHYFFAVPIKGVYSFQTVCYLLPWHASDIYSLIKPHVVVWMSHLFPHLVPTIAGKNAASLVQSQNSYIHNSLYHTFSAMYHLPTFQLRSILQHFTLGACDVYSIRISIYSENKNNTNQEEFYHVNIRIVGCLVHCNRYYLI